jgi:hypothetical protein
MVAWEGGEEEGRWGTARAQAPWKVVELLMAAQVAEQGEGLDAVAAGEAWLGMVVAGVAAVAAAGTGRIGQRLREEHKLPWSGCLEAAERTVAVGRAVGGTARP